MTARRRAWDGYWTTKVGWAAEGKIIVRGYRAEELIRHLHFAEAAYLVIRGELPTRRQAAALDAVLRSGLDQAFINSAVPPARFAASAAPESPARQCAELLLETRGAMIRDGVALPAMARRVVEEHAGRGARIPGIGHPMHKRIEPRARALREVAAALGAWGAHGRLLEAIARQARRHHGRPLPVNLAGAIAAVLLEIGFAPLEMVGLAVMSYMPSLIAHTVEEIREGVPLRIIPEALGARYAGRGQRRLPARGRRGRE
ncbi:MAG: hypothetical protein A2X52_09600 [Candidatus Rokubacteria bacterium GWC2_70_16]|nr:MAG: hypothetical protein A2X52_09600 [Candidatus Rokubacteria bacterium GWC2_70_16]